MKRSRFAGNAQEASAQFRHAWKEPGFSSLTNWLHGQAMRRYRHQTTGGPILGFPCRAVGTIIQLFGVLDFLPGLP